MLARVTCHMRFTTSKPLLYAVLCIRLNVGVLLLSMNYLGPDLVTMVDFSHRLTGQLCDLVPRLM
jgi:hypothetical protein